MHFICRSFIGKDNSQFWSQTWENEPDSISNSQGHLFGLISLQNQDSDLDLKTLGREIINQLNQSFFSQPDGEISQKLIKTIEVITQNDSLSHLKIDLSLLIIHHHQAYIGVYGQTQVVFQRNSQISNLISGFTHQFSQISGPVKNDDKIILATADFVNQVGWEKIKSTIIDSKIQNIEESFISSLYSFENQNNLSSFLIEIRPDDVDSESSFDPSAQPESTPIPDPIVVTETSKLSPQPILPPAHLQSHQPDIYVKNKFKFKIGGHKKIQLFVALFLLIGLIISSYFGYQKNQAQKAETSFQTLKSELENKLNNISVVKNLNIEATYQSAKEAKDIISKMSQLKIHSDEINQYKSQVDLILSQSGDSDSFKPTVIYDTSLIVNNPKFSQIAFSKSNLYLLDSTNGRLDSLLPKEKSTKNIIISDQVKSATKILIDSNNLYLLSKNQISLVEKSGLTQKVDLSSSSITVTDAQLWNGSFYILDRNSQSVWKSTPSASGYSSPQNWLKNDAKLELGVDSLSIDGRIWILTESGQIYLYNSGIKEKYKQNQEISFTKASNLVTDVDSDYLVFSDNSKLIYVYKKTGDFGFKFNLGDLQVLDIAFDGPNKTIYFLASDQKIYQITL